MTSAKWINVILIFFLEEIALSGIYECTRKSWQPPYHHRPWNNVEWQACVYFHCSSRSVPNNKQTRSVSVEAAVCISLVRTRSCGRTSSVGMAFSPAKAVHFISGSPMCSLKGNFHYVVCRHKQDIAPPSSCGRCPVRCRHGTPWLPVTCTPEPHGSSWPSQ